MPWQPLICYLSLYTWYSGYFTLRKIIQYMTFVTYCIAHGTLLNVMCQPGWERSLGENRYMCMYGWVPSLFTWNYHNFVNWLCPNTKQKSLKFEKNKNKKYIWPFYLVSLIGHYDFNNKKINSQVKKWVTKKTGQRTYTNISPKMANKYIKRCLTSF